MLHNRFERLIELHLNCDRHANDSTASDASESSSPERYRRNVRHIQKTIPAKHKTELCKSFSELGSCRYGEKCRFAHGVHELKKLSIPNENYRKRPCKNWESGECRYGMRCQFRHLQQLDWEINAALAGLTSLACPNEGHNQSRLLNILKPTNI